MATLIQRIIRQAGFLSFLFEHYICPNTCKPIDRIDTAELYSLIDSVGKERAQEIHDIFKVISNRLLDFGMDHTEKYLSGKEEL